MTKVEKVNFTIKTLGDLYPEIPIPLDHKDPYTLLVAVLLSAQSTDVRVNKITPLLFERADNPYDMVKLSIEEIREIIKPVGQFLRHRFSLKPLLINDDKIRKKYFKKHFFQTFIF